MWIQLFYMDCERASSSSEPFVSSGDQVLVFVINTIWFWIAQLLSAFFAQRIYLNKFAEEKIYKQLFPDIISGASSNFEHNIGRFQAIYFEQ